MAEHIDREAAIAVIEEKQKELCPVGMYSRHAVYGSDREKFDAWQEIIDRLEGLPAADVEERASGIIGVIPTADVRPVKQGKWISADDGKTAVRMKYGEPQASCKCSVCGEWLVASDEYDVKGNFCPNCGADMRREEE